MIRFFSNHCTHIHTYSSSYFLRWIKPYIRALNVVGQDLADDHIRLPSHVWYKVTMFLLLLLLPQRCFLIDPSVALWGSLYFMQTVFVMAQQFCLLAIVSTNRVVGSGSVISNYEIPPEAFQTDIFRVLLIYPLETNLSLVYTRNGCFKTKFEVLHTVLFSWQIRN